MTIPCIIRPEVPADFRSVAQMTRSAFDGRREEVDMINSIRASDEYLPELSLVAEVEGSVVGHCLLRRASLSGPPTPPVLMLGPLGVHPDWQGQGIGGRLITAAQDQARRRRREPLHRLRRAMLAYPDGARVVTGARPPHTPTLASIPEYALRALEDSGLTLPQSASVSYTVVHYTFGHVIEEQDSAEAQPTKEFQLAYPCTTRVMTEGLNLTATDSFDTGLSLIIEHA